MFTSAGNSKRLVAVLVSVMMALPVPSWGSSVDVSGGDTTEGIPVILQPIQTPDGRSAYLAIAPIPVELESEFVTTAAKTDAKNMVLVVSGPDDPAFKAAQKSGKLQQIKTFFSSQAVEDAPLSQAPQLSRGIKGKFLSAVNKVTGFHKNKQKQFALGMSVYVGGVYGAFTFIESSSIASGLAVFGAVMSWVGFQTAFTHSWEKVLEKGGQAFVDVFSAAAGLIGKELSADVKRVVSAAGSFSIPWAANTALLSWVFANSGTTESLLATVLYAFAISYDIYDKNISNLIHRGKLGGQWLTRFVAIRAFIGTLFEVASFSEVPYIQATLTTVTAAGLLWLAMGSKFEDKVIGRIDRFKKDCQAMLQKPAGDGL